MAHATHAPQIAYLGGQSNLSPLAVVALRVAVTVTVWSERRRTRQHLIPKATASDSFGISGIPDAPSI